MKKFAVYTEQVNAMRFVVSARSEKEAVRKVQRIVKGYIPDVISSEETTEEAKDE